MSASFLHQLDAAFDELVLGDDDDDDQNTNTTSVSSLASSFPDGSFPSSNDHPQQQHQQEEEQQHNDDKNNDFVGCEASSPSPSSHSAFPATTKCSTQLPRPAATHAPISLKRTKRREPTISALDLHLQQSMNNLCDTVVREVCARRSATFASSFPSSSSASANALVKKRVLSALSLFANEICEQKKQKQHQHQQQKRAGGGGGGKGCVTNEGGVGEDDDVVSVTTAANKCVNNIMVACTAAVVTEASWIETLQLLIRDGLVSVGRSYLSAEAARWELVQRQLPDLSQVLRAIRLEEVRLLVLRSNFSQRGFDIAAVKLTCQPSCTSDVPLGGSPSPLASSLLLNNNTLDAIKNLFRLEVECEQTKTAQSLASGNLG